MLYSQGGYGNAEERPERPVRFTSNGRCQRYVTSPFTLLGNNSDKPRVRAEPDEPKAPYASDCSTPNIFLIDSSHSITIRYES